MKVLIVEDERKICQLIQYLIHWEELGLTPAGAAYDGLEALRLIEEQHPDIVITDIRMPGCDGLELIERTKKSRPDTRFIIISGYRDFEYARRAMRFGVEDYLSKPIQEKELNQAIEKLVSAGIEERNRVENVKRMEQTIERQSSQIKNSFFRSLIRSSFTLSLADSLQAVNLQYHCSFEPGVFQIVYIRPDFPVKQDYDLLFEEFTREIMKCAEEELNDSCFELITVSDDLGVCLLLNYAEQSLSDLRWHLKHIRKKCTNSPSLEEQLRITVGLGRRTSGLSDLSLSYQDAWNAILNRIFLGTNILIGVNTSAGAPEISTETILTADYKNRFLQKIEIFDAKHLRQMLLELCQTCKETEGIDGVFLFQVYQELCNLFLLGIRKNGSQMNNRKLEDAFQKSFLRCITLDEIFDDAAALMCSCLQEQYEAEHQKDIQPVRAAKQFILENYTSTIRLEDMAQMAGFNASYFSTLFKKETGQTLTEYVLEVRMEKAKELLKDKDIRINAIPEHVGIGDVKYFSKQFKKFTGLTPSQYRKFFG